MRTSSRFSRQQAERTRARCSRMGKASQAAQRTRREAAMTPEVLRDLAAAQPCCPGAAIGSIEYRNFLSGTVHRWTILRGDRINNYALRTPDGRASKPHGMSWITAKLRRLFIRL